MGLGVCALVLRLGEGSVKDHLSLGGRLGALALACTWARRCSNFSPSKWGANPCKEASSDEPAPADAAFAGAALRASASDAPFAASRWRCSGPRRRLRASAQVRGRRF